MSNAITDLRAKYLAGSRPEFTLTFVNTAGDPVDPAAITVVVRDPNGDELSYSSGAGHVVRLALGSWQFVYPSTGLANIPGTWYIRTTSTGTVVSEISSFEVGVSPFEISVAPIAVPDSPAVVNVRDYGAVGDGTTDDTDAITDAITAAASAGGGGCVFFPSTATGSAYIASTLYLPDYVGLRGETKATTIKKLAASTGPLITSSTTSSGGYQAWFESITLDGNKSAAPSGTDGIGQHPSAASTEGFIGQSVIMRDVQVKDCVRDGIRIGITSGNKVLHVLDNVRSTYNGGVGIQVIRGTDLWILNGWCAENGLAAILLDQCSAVRLNALQLEGNDDASKPIARSANRPLLRLQGGSRIVTIGAGCTFSSGCRAIYATGDVTSLSISNSWINGNNGDNNTYPAIEFATGTNLNGILIDSSVHFSDDSTVNVGTPGTQTHYVKFGTPSSARDIQISTRGMASANVGTSPSTALVAMPASTATYGNVGCSLFTTTDQVVTTGAYTSVLFGASSENYDPDNLHSTSSSTEIITIKRPGPYQILGGLTWLDAASGDRLLDLVAGGVTVCSDRRNATASSRSNNAVQWSGFLAAGAQVYMQVYQDAGASRTIDYASLSVMPVG